MKRKKWHIFDFPDNLYVLLKRKCREKFFDTMYTTFGSQKKYAIFLVINRNCVQGYHYARYWHNNKKRPKYLPLWVLKKSLPFIPANMKRIIEKNIVSIRGKGGGQINNPKLPFQESPSFYKIVAHLIGDGNDSHTPYYSNTCKYLREQFGKKLKFFGEIVCTETRSTQNPQVYLINFTKTITNILKHILDLEFTHPSKLPSSIFSASEECKKALLQALFDDEAWVSTNIGIGMKEKRLIEELKILCESIGVKTSKLTFSKNAQGNGTYVFNIRSKSILTFREKIGFSHPEKNQKLEMRSKIIKRNKKQRTRPLEWTRNEIFRLLKEKPLSTLQLSEKLLLTMAGLYHHLNYLERKKCIKRTGHKNRIVWKLNLRPSPPNFPI